MAFLDFQQIKADNPIETVAEKLGLTVEKRGSQLRGKCPVCKTGGDRALAITPAKGVFYCFGNKTGGDAIQLVAHIQGCDVKAAAAYLADTVPEEKEQQEGDERGFKPLAYLEADHEAVVALGLDPADASRLGVGYAKRGVMRGTVAWPVRLSDGTLIGYIGVTEAVLPSSWHF